jgi:hypothetical protein
MRFEVLTVMSIAISLSGYDAVCFDRYVTSKELAALVFRLERKFPLYCTWLYVICEILNLRLNFFAFSNVNKQ